MYNAVIICINLYMFNIIIATFTYYNERKEFYFYIYKNDSFRNVRKLSTCYFYTDNNPFFNIIFILIFASSLFPNISSLFYKYLF